MTKEDYEIIRAKAQAMETMSETHGWRLLAESMQEDIQGMQIGLERVDATDSITIKDLQSRIDILRIVIDTPEKYQRDLKYAKEQFEQEELDRQFALPERT